MMLRVYGLMSISVVVWRSIDCFGMEINRFHGGTKIGVFSTPIGLDLVFQEGCDVLTSIVEGLDVPGVLLDAVPELSTCGKFQTLKLCVVIEVLGKCLGTLPTDVEEGLRSFHTVSPLL